MLLVGTNKKTYGKVTRELNNAYLTGQKGVYSWAVESAMTMLLNYMDIQEEKRGDRIKSMRRALHKEGIRRTSVSTMENLDNVLPIVMSQLMWRMMRVQLVKSQIICHQVAT